MAALIRSPAFLVASRRRVAGEVRTPVLQLVVYVEGALG
jgi:hypothetical protein